MKTKEFLHLLEKNQDKELIFEYQQGKLIGTNYHLTEVKNVDFKTVDCGGNSNDWKETHIQLWESPNEIGKTDYLTTTKALDILKRVNGIAPLWLETTIKAEFGNETFHTSVLKLEEFSIDSNRLTIQLFEEKTLCKAPSTCGVEEELEEKTACCEPSSNCC